MSPPKHTSAFVGFGQSRVFRQDEVPLGELAVEASHTAIADAGLDVSQIDGVCCIPDPPFAMDYKQTDGVQFVTTEYMIEALGINAKWNTNARGMLGNSAIEAIRAVETGLCNYVLLFRALHSPAGAYGHTSEEAIGGPAQFTVPYGKYFPTDLAGMAWGRYRDIYRSGSREQMATYVIQERHNGLMYEGGYWAQYRPTELTLEDYMTARTVCSPASIFDCDLPVQGAGAFVITTAERGRDLSHPPAYVRGVAVSNSNFSSLGLTLEYQLAHGKSVGNNLWADSGLRPEDVQVADLYDGFSMITICWLESLGFCGEGEAFDFIQDGRIAIDGKLPVNPSGGNLGAGRLHGVNHLMDGMLQVMGRSGPRQIPHAKMSVVAIGPPSAAGAAVLLGNEPP